MRGRAILGVIVGLLLVIATTTNAGATSVFPAKLKIVEPKEGKVYNPGKIPVKAIVISKRPLPPAIAKIYLDGKLVKIIPLYKRNSYQIPIKTFVRVYKLGAHELHIKVEAAIWWSWKWKQVICEERVKFFVKKVQDNTPPVLEILIPRNGQKLVSPVPVLIYAKDDSGSVKVFAVISSKQYRFAMPVRLHKIGDYYYAFVPLKPGDYVLSVMAYDPAGHKVSKKVEFEVVPIFTIQPPVRAL